VAANAFHAIADGKVIAIQTGGVENACNYATLEDNLKALKSALAKSNDRAHLLSLQTR
jgi:hypothetical protein